ncbi:hypothetical protein PIB30_079148 [Stylosanthes scabra]|uniref:Uncharacterized protein n=1 Tax=Stylosanthes scabra TaxID=79078 RepID=A0ABU6TRG0_9FABA|nr:hypothetical protein [Stylosanthes scabra]
MLEALIQERLELQDIQQKMVDQLTVLKEAIMPDLVAQAPPKRDTTTPKGNSEGLAAAQREVITNSTEPIAEKMAHLPYPTASKRSKKGEDYGQTNH